MYGILTSTTETATGTTATKATGTVATTSHAATGTSRTTRSHASTHTGTCFFRAKKIQAVYNVQHGIAVDGVILVIGTRHGIDGTREIRLLMQNVIKLQCDSQRLTREEAL